MVGDGNNGRRWSVANVHTHIAEPSRSVCMCANSEKECQLYIQRSKLMRFYAKQNFEKIGGSPFAQITLLHVSRQKIK